MTSGGLSSEAGLEEEERRQAKAFIRVGLIVAVVCGANYGLYATG
eukprot:gene37917-21027_t